MNREIDIIALYQAQLTRIREVWEDIGPKLSIENGSLLNWENMRPIDERNIEALRASINDARAETAANAFQSPPTRHID